MNNNLNEGLIKSLFDNAAVFEIVRRLGTPFDQTKAFKMGLIDARGNFLKKRRDLTPQEKSSLSLFDVMIFNLKKLLLKYTHSSNLVPVASSLLLLKESVENQKGITETQVNQIVEDICNDFVRDTEYKMFLESEAPVNVSNPGINTSATLPITNIAYPDNLMEPPVDPKKYELKGLQVYKLDKKEFSKIKKRQSTLKENTAILIMCKDTNERFLIVK